MSTTRNSGKLQQDSLINKFKRDARSSDRNSATAIAIREGRAQREKFAKENPKPLTEVRFIPSHPNSIAKKK